MNIIVLASGNGTNLGAIIDAIKNEVLPNVVLKGVFSDVEGSGALQKAKDFGVPGIFVNPEGLSREKYDEKMIAEIKKTVLDEWVDVVCLIGFMRVLSAVFLRKFDIVINVHPSLLPKFGGKGMYGDRVHEAVLNAGETESGMTIHRVSEIIDGGEIILQKSCTISSDETIFSLKKKVQSLEMIGYVDVLKVFSMAEKLTKIRNDVR